MPKNEVNSVTVSHSWGRSYIPPNPELCLISGPPREDPYNDCVEASSLRDTEEEENEGEKEERKDGGVAFPAAVAA